MQRRGIVARTVIIAICAVAVMLPPTVAGATDDAPKTGRETVLSGIYSDQWDAGRDIAGLSKASPTPVSLAGTFHTLRESADGWGPGATHRLLEQVWSAQATPFANVHVPYSAFEVARGDADDDIAEWASRVRSWLDQGDGRSLLIAPMQEMNGNWVPYGMDPGNYRIAFRRFVEISTFYGLVSEQVRWVFAPNGWSVPPYSMADYWPGEDVVDIVGVSAYNFGAAVDFWTPVEWAVTAALEEIRRFAPDKPYVLAQVGSSTAGGDRDAWLREMFRVSARDPNVVGLVYFNFIKETDWKLWDGETVAQGWLDGVSDDEVRHVWPLTGWFGPGEMEFQVHEGRFADDDLLPVRDDIDWLADRGIVTGCGTESFCPTSVVSRGQLATLLVRALGLQEATTEFVRDDDGTVHEADIDAVLEAGVMDVCGPKRFCPDSPATRDVLGAAFASARQAGVDEPPAPAWERGPDEPICVTPRACQKKSLTRTWVAAALRAHLETMPPPIDDDAPEQDEEPATVAPWWTPPR